MRLAPGMTEMEITGSELFIKVLSEPHLCALLNPNLTEFQIKEIKETFHVVQIEHGTTWYNAIVLGYYKPNRLPENPEKLAAREARVVAFWNS